MKTPKRHWVVQAYMPLRGGGGRGRKGRKDFEGERGKGKRA